MSSWFSQKTEKRTSPIAGRGLFARHTISAGEIVGVKGGAIMDSDALALIRNDVSPAEIQIEDDLYIAPRTAAEVEGNILCKAGGDIALITGSAGAETTAEVYRCEPKARLNESDPDDRVWHPWLRITRVL
jgi:hypothetical protein